MIGLRAETGMEESDVMIEKIRVPSLIGSGPNMLHRKVVKTIHAKDENGQGISYVVALFRGGALGVHDSQSIRIWYNYSYILGRYKASSQVFCALDMEDKACEVLRA